MSFVRSLTDCPELAEGVAARIGCADLTVLTEPRAPVPSEAEGLASGPIHQFINNLLKPAEAFLSHVLLSS